MPASAAQRALARQRQQQAVDMRLAGHTFDDIAHAVGYRDRAAAHKAYEAALDRTLRPATDDARALEVDRLERLQRAHWDNALTGDPKAAAVVLSCIDRRAKLLGLDAPTRIQVMPSEVDAQIEALCADLNVRAATPETAQ